MLRWRIDATGIKNLGRAFKKIGVDVRKKGVHVPLNRAGLDVQRDAKTALQRWTGLRRTGVIAQAMRAVPAGPGRLRFVMNVTSPWFAVTKENFGANWSRAMPGVAHQAWQGGNMERGAFMHGGRAYHRTGASRYPIKTLWGSNIARELERHDDEMRVMAGRSVRQHMLPAVHRAQARAIARAKATFGL